MFFEISNSIFFSFYQRYYANIFKKLEQVTEFCLVAFNFKSQQKKQLTKHE